MQYNQRTLLYVASTLLYVAAALLYVVVVLLYVLVVWWNTSTVLLYNINIHALQKNLKMAKQMVLFLKHWAKTGGFETKSGEQSPSSKAKSLHQACGGCRARRCYGTELNLIKQRALGIATPRRVLPGPTDKKPAYFKFFLK